MSSSTTVNGMCYIKPERVVVVTPTFKINGFDCRYVISGYKFVEDYIFSHEKFVVITINTSFE